MISRHLIRPSGWLFDFVGAAPVGAQYIQSGVDEMRPISEIR
jgi:hypothetical protein